jgi:hypothetical protein
MKWFDADKEGLRKIGERLVERRGFGIIGAELYQNVMDTNATECRITLTKLSNKHAAELVCEDNDPEGFTNLTHAYTVFAPSLKKADPTKGGRFNIGEKFVLAFCREAKIETTKGTVEFDAEGRHEYPRRKRKVGTKFWAVIDCTNERFDQFVQAMRRIIVKPGLRLFVNDEEVPHRRPIAVFEETLATEKADEKGNLRPTQRKSGVEIYEVAEGEIAMLFELGIPVVETGDKWHYSVQQKVPLNVDRDNVTPAFLRDLRTYVFNHMHKQINEDDTEAEWVNEATSDEKVTLEALADFKKKKYGEDAVAEDPFNPDANAAAMVDGRTVIPKHGLSQGQRENLKKIGLLPSSSQAYPTAGKRAYSDDPDARPINVIPRDKWTEGMKLCYEYTQGVAERLIGKRLDIQFVSWTKRDGGTWRACYGTGWLLGLPEFHYNVGILGKRWFDNGVTEDMDSLILHELGHEYCTNHADKEYYRALTKLGAKLKAAALADPEWFKRFE